MAEDHEMNTLAAKSCMFIGIYRLLFSLFLVCLCRVLYNLLLLLSILPHKLLKLLLYISNILANGNDFKSLKIYFSCGACLASCLSPQFAFVSFQQRSGFSKTQSTLL